MISFVTGDQLKQEAKNTSGMRTVTGRTQASVAGVSRTLGMSMRFKSCSCRAGLVHRDDADSPLLQESGMFQTLKYCSEYPAVD